MIGVPWRRYHCPGCGATTSPDIGFQLGRSTARFQRRCLRLCVNGTFGETQDYLRQEHGASVSTKYLLDLTRRLGESAPDDALELIPEREPKPNEKWAIQIDGMQLPLLDGWEEVKSVVVGRVIPGPDGSVTLTDKVHFAVRGDVATFEAGFEKLLFKLKLRKDQVTLMGDGAPWIWNLFHRHFPRGRETLDFYHAAEHVSSVVTAVMGANSKLGRDYMRESCHDLKHEPGGVSGLFNFIDRNVGNTALSEGDRTILKKERAYFESHAGRMDYPSRRSEGWPIGTGVVESSHKHVIQARMKGSGKRWSESGADHMIAMRVLRANGQFDDWFVDAFQRAA